VEMEVARKLAVLELLFERLVACLFALLFVADGLRVWKPSYRIWRLLPS
jgi:hypothetical protein